jgi:hypothetical protein
MTAFRRRRLVIAIVVVAALAGGYALYWRVTARMLADALALWTAARQGEGYRVEGMDAPVTGFPFAFRLHAEAPVLAAPDGAWTWHGPALEALARPWQPFRIFFSAPGRHYLEFAASPRPGRIVVTAGALNGETRFEGDGAPRRFSLAVADLTAIEDPGAALALAGATLELFQDPAGGDDRPFALALSGLALPAAAVLDPVVSRLEAAGTLRGAFAPGAPRQSLAGWREAGGALDLGRLDLAWGPLGASGDGTFALDRALQPEGAMNLALTGYGEALDRLVAAKLIASDDGLIAKLALDATAGPDGAARVPVTIQEQTLYIGPLPLLRLAPVPWP